MHTPVASDIPGRLRRRMGPRRTRKRGLQDGSPRILYCVDWMRPSTRCLTGLLAET